MLEFLAHLAGMSSDTVNELEKASPAAAQLVSIVKEAQPLIEQAEPLIDKLLPLVVKAWPLIKQAEAEIKSVTPAAKNILAFINQQQAPADQSATASNAVT